MVALVPVYPVGENEHRNGILHITIVPARVDEALAARARQQALQLVDELDYVGVLAVEFFIDSNDELSAVLNLIADGTFSHGDTEVFKPLVDNLRYDDPFLVCADYASYVECQARVSAAWLDGESWTKMSILNTARSGKFSSDRAIAEYCDDIWKVWPLTVKI